MAVLQPGSRQYVYVDVDNGAGLLPVEVTAIYDGQDLDPDQAQWWTAESEDADTIRILIGPGGTGHELNPGDYTLYLRITAAPEVPIEQSGPLKIL